MNRANYLRLSVIDKCNLNCIYCKPEEIRSCANDAKILTLEEIGRLGIIFSRCGIDTVRITGGEPLCRRDIMSIISKISVIAGFRDLSLTTNGILLSEFARDLKKSGLKRVNISLNSLDKECLIKISGKDILEKVILGIKASFDAGLGPIKINSVVLRNFNEGQICKLAAITLCLPISVRFIEYAPTSINMPSFSELGVANSCVKKIIEDKFSRLSFDEKAAINGPAKYYKIKNSLGNIGFINGYSEYFCHNCNRLRLSSRGKLFSCLYSKDYLDIANLLRRQKTPLFKAGMNGFLGRSSPMESDTTCRPHRSRRNPDRIVGKLIQKKSPMIYHGESSLRLGEPDNNIKRKIEDFIDTKHLYTKNSIKERKLEMSKIGG